MGEIFSVGSGSSEFLEMQIAPVGSGLTNPGTALLIFWVSISQLQTCVALLNVQIELRIYLRFYSGVGVNRR